MKFQHLAVNHTDSFVDPDTRLHTQAIESQWNKCKSLIKAQKGIIGGKLDVILAELIWKNNISEREGFQSVIELMK